MAKKSLAFPKDAEFPELFSMSGKELRALAKGRSKRATPAQAELDRRKAKGIATGKRSAPKAKAKA